MPPHSRRVVVGGNIATGKTHVLTVMCGALELPGFPERWHDNPWFVGDPRDAFLAQTWFLLAAGADQARMSSGGGIQERCIHEHAHVFAREQLAHESAQPLAAIYERLDTSLPDPDLLVYLKAPVPVLHERIRRRGRAQEQSLTMQQLERLQARYDDLIAGWTRCAIIEIDTDVLDVRTAEGMGHVLDRTAEEFT